MGTRYYNRDVRIGQKEKWKTEDVMDRHVQNSNRRTKVTTSRKTKGME
jgi:hypothetical protein